MRRKIVANLLPRLDIAQKGCGIRAVTSIAVISRPARLRSIRYNHALRAIDPGEPALQRQ